MASMMNPFCQDQRRYPRSETYPFECPYCDTTWSTASLLEEHIIDNHKQEKNEICQPSNQEQH